MRRGEPRDLGYTRRHGAMTAAHAIRDFWDLTVELVTNCDDSYHAQYRDGEISEDGGAILLEVEPHRGSTPSVVTVRDRASGFRDLLSKIERVGAKTSEAGDRGFMARGLKDCAALGHITVETIIEGRIDKAEITRNFQVIPYVPGRKGLSQVTKDDRKRLSIRRGSGTVVTASLEPRVAVPRLETLRRELPWHYALRDIAAPDAPSKLLLRYAGEDVEPLLAVPPDGEAVYDREDQVPGYERFRFRFQLWRANAPLEDPGDPRFRRSGILLKGRRAIHGSTFFASELERDPGADHYFGRLQCDGIDIIAEEWDARRETNERHPAENPGFVLDPSRRGGLVEDHPFVKALFRLAAAALKEQLERERATRETRKREVEAKETTERLRKLAREASRFMREKLEDLGAIAPGDKVDNTSFHQVGVGLSPVFTQIPVGATKAFTVRANRERLDLPPGTPIHVGLSKNSEGCLELVEQPKPLEADPLDSELLRGSFSLRGRGLVRTVEVACQVDGLPPVHAQAQVIPAEPEDLEIPGDLAFHRKRYTVRQGGRRALVLRGRFESPLPPPVQLRLSDPSVAVVREHGRFQPVGGTTYYEATFILEGRKPNGNTRVIAECDERSTECDVTVAEKDEQGVDLKFRLVNYDLGASYRAVWDRKEPNTLLITTKHESTSRYLGAEREGYPGQNGQAFRVLLAELIADNVCRRIVEAHVRTQPESFDSDKLYLLHNRLMKEFTPIAHRIQLSSPS